MVSGTGVSPGERFLALVASGELTRSAMEVVGPTRVRVLGATTVLPARVTTTAHCPGRRFDADEWTTDVVVRRGGRRACAHIRTTPVRSTS